jgi:hypothetical protein
VPLYTPVGGSWLNMAESIQRVLKRWVLAGQYPHSIRETIIRYSDLAAKRRTESK